MEDDLLPSGGDYLVRAVESGEIAAAIRGGFD
jgi:hypothetical protein